jgi:hypothetical protein
MAVEKNIVLSVRMTETLKRRIDQAALRSGLTTLDWLRAVLARAANEGAFAPRERGTHGRKR